MKFEDGVKVNFLNEDEILLLKTMEDLNEFNGKKACISIFGKRKRGRTPTHKIKTKIFDDISNVDKEMSIIYLRNGIQRKLMSDNPTVLIETKVDDVNKNMEEIDSQKTQLFKELGYKPISVTKKIKTIIRSYSDWF